MALLKKSSCFIMSLGLIMPVLVWAQVENPLESQGINDFPTFVRAVANIVATVGGIIAVIFIIYAGYLFVTARGDTQKLELAKSTFQWTIIGAAVLMGAYAIANAVISVVTSLG